MNKNFFKTITVILTITMMPIVGFAEQKDIIAEIQTNLKDREHYQGEIDSVYGEDTKEAVKNIQEKFGLEITGEIDRVSLAYMGISPDRIDEVENIVVSRGSIRTGSGLVVTEEEKMLIARTITAEARGESYEGQVAVGAVIINRVLSPTHPDTVEGVIYQKNAFSVVNNGSIDKPPTETSIKAAEDALKGVDPTGECLYFWNPKTAKSTWINTRTVMAVIGNHNFGI